MVAAVVAVLLPGAGVTEALRQVPYLLYVCEEGFVKEGSQGCYWGGGSGTDHAGAPAHVSG